MACLRRRCDGVNWLCRASLRPRADYDVADSKSEKVLGIMALCLVVVYLEVDEKLIISVALLKENDWCSKIRYGFAL